MIDSRRKMDGLKDIGKTIECKRKDCHVEFIKKYWWHDFCSSICRRKAWDDQRMNPETAELVLRIDSLKEGIRNIEKELGII